MTMIRRAAAVAATALIGITVLAGCSSSSGTSTSSSATASVSGSPDGSSSMLPPIIISPNENAATAKVGDSLDIVIPAKSLAGTTVDTDKPELVALTQAHQDGTAIFNPGGKALAPGVANIIVTNPDNSTRTIVLTITQ